MTRHIVCICGSGRFWNEILQAASDLTLKGNIVLQPNFNAKGERVIRPIDKDRLDVLHLEKIDMAHEVFVVNQNGYIGESTGNEIRHALKTGKRVTFLDAETGNAWVKANVVADASGKSILLPDPEVVTLRRAAALFHNERTQLLQDVCVLLEQCEVAWGVIANVNGGDWKPTPDDWRGAAEKWRDRWHEILRSPIMAKTEKLRAERQLQERVSRTIDAAKAGRMEDVQGELAAITDLLRQAWSEEKETGA
jgi:hypothetical protein